jgi:hypothetical protein
MTGAEAVALGQRLVASIESAMMATDPEREPFALVVLAAERAEAMALLAEAARRARAMKAERGTHLHARWAA